MLLLSCWLLLIAPAGGAGANVIAIDWGFPASPATSLTSRTVSVGDTMTFLWSSTSGTHNVFIHPTKSCVSTGSIFVGDSNGATYTFSQADVGDVVFACEVTGHCEAGMIITVTVNEPSASSSSSPAAATTTTTAGSGTPSPSAAASIIVPTYILLLMMVSTHIGIALLIGGAAAV